MIFAEINELMGPDVLDLFERDGWELEMRKDLQGKDRMIKGWKS
jgi:methylase of polypeptide subunit release factors